MEAKHNPIGHEADNVDVRGVGLLALAIAIGVAVIFLGVYGAFRYLAADATRIPSTNPLAETEQQKFPPPPRIEEHPARELQELNQTEDRVISTYGWVDKRSGIVRIPIDQAMELQLKRGFPVRKEAAAK